MSAKGGEPIKVMIIDDSAVVRQTLTSLLSSDEQIEVIATAQDPLMAMRKLEKQKPDVYLLDVEMPRMDGLTFLQNIMKEDPRPVIICSSKTEEGSANALRALDLGAVEIIQKPKLGTKQFLTESYMLIIDAVKAAHVAKLKNIAPESVKRKYAAPPSVEPKRTADVILPAAKAYTLETTETIVAVGASTGGVEALRVFLAKLPANAPGIVIVQHMPEHFTRAFAKRLDSICTIRVKEADDNDTVIRGTALIAPGNRHLLLKRSGSRYYVNIKDGPFVCRHRPSVDVLFRSAARYAGKNVIGVLMTGMGDDGARGMVELKENGGRTIVQDEKSCVVFGMPFEAIRRNTVDEVLPLEKISDKILEYVQ